MRLKIRRFAGLSYACRTLTASSAFLCPASASSLSSRFGLAVNGKGRHHLQVLQRLSRLDRRLSFSLCPASATCSSDHKLPFLCGKKRRFGSSSYVCRSITVASAFLFILHNIPTAFFYDGLDAEQFKACLLSPLG